MFLKIYINIFQLVKFVSTCILVIYLNFVHFKYNYVLFLILQMVAANKICYVTVFYLNLLN